MNGNNPIQRRACQAAVFMLDLSPSEKAVAIATGTGEVGDDDFIIVRIDVVVVAALDHLLTTLEAPAPVKVLVVLVAHGATYFS